MVLEEVMLWPLFGEASVLLLREGSPDLGRAPEEPAWRCDGRAGDESREAWGVLALDGDPETFSERTPLRAWPDARIGAAGAVSDADAGGGARWAEGSRVAVGDGIWGGVVVSAWPVTERKESEAEADMVTARVQRQQKQ